MNRHMKGKANGKNSQRNDKNTDVDSLISSLVAQKVKEALNGSLSVVGGAATAPSTPLPSMRGKRLYSERSEPDTDAAGTTPSADDGAKDGADSMPPPRKKITTDSKGNTDYASQVVILDGVSDGIKNHPTRLSKAFADTKPEVRIKGLRKTASGGILVTPKDPKDCNALLKEGAFPRGCPLGETVTARLPKSQTVTHQVVIKQVDTEVTTEEIEQFLKAQELPYKAVKRIHSRERGKPTEMVRLFLSCEDDKKRLLKQGIYLDQMHFKCCPAKEDLQSFPKIFQCFNCQKIGDHLASDCKEQQKCVLCSGSHRKDACKAEKKDFKCANCQQNHPSWSPECSHIANAKKSKEKPTMAQVASATVTPEFLAATTDSIVDSIKESLALIISDVISRCICELVLDIVGNKLNKKDLPTKVEKIAKDATNATNFYTKTIGTQGKLVAVDHVQQNTKEKCFSKSGTVNTTSSSASSQNGL